MSDKEKKQMSGFSLAGFRSYADEQRDRSAGKGGSRGNQTAVNEVAIQFCWPRDNSFVTATNGSIEEEDDDDNNAGRDRYPDREVFSDHGNESHPPAEIQEDEDSGDDDSEDDAADDDEDGDPNRLSKKLQSIPLQATVASAGRQEGMRCCLDALQAVLRALFPGAPDLPRADLEALEAAVSHLNGVELETFDKMRKDLARIGGESADWEPLERVLALRPNFFRLFRSSKGNGIGPSIGPKSGPSADDNSEELWDAWKLAAQITIRSLGRVEQQYLRAYIHYCIERRRLLNSSSGALQPGISDSPKAKPASQPTADLAPIVTSEEYPDLVPGAGIRATVEWGKNQRKQIVPKIASAPARKEPDTVDAWGDSDEDDKPIDEFPLLEVADNFPALGGKSTGGKSVNASWAKQSHAKSTLGNATSAAPPKASAKPKAAVPMAVDFPSLIGNASSAPSKAEQWAKAREQSAVAAKAKAEMAKPKPPQPPKEFQGIEEVAFPDLPLAAPKQKSAASKAKGKAASSKAKAKAKVTASIDSEDLVAAVIPESVQAEPEIELVPDSQLILIHEPCDPLEAVARSEAAEAERRAKKVKSKSGKRGAVVNPWTAGSPISRG